MIKDQSLIFFIPRLTLANPTSLMWSWWWCCQGPLFWISLGEYFDSLQYCHHGSKAELIFSVSFKNYTREGFSENSDYSCRAMGIKCHKHSCMFAHLFTPQEKALGTEYFIQKLSFVQMRLLYCSWLEISRSPAILSKVPLCWPPWDLFMKQWLLASLCHETGLQAVGICVTL